jgi:hypothetical protein
MNGKGIRDVDVLNKKIFDMPIFGERCCSYWPISHFVFYFILGLFFPQCGLIAMTLGVLWEIFETLFGRVMEGVSQNPTPTNDSANVEYNGQWMTGSLKDILFNFAGFYSAKALLYIFRGGRPVPLPFLKKDRCKICKHNP